MHFSIAAEPLILKSKAYADASSNLDLLVLLTKMLKFCLKPV